MLHTKFHDNRPTGSGEKHIFTLYVHGGHLGHVTWTPRTNFRSPIPWMLHMKSDFNRRRRCLKMLTDDSLFVLRFYGPVNPMGSCRARSVYLTTRLLDRLSPLSG